LQNLPAHVAVTERRNKSDLIINRTPFFFGCCSERWLTLVTRQWTQADILGALLKNRRLIRVGERKVLFKDAVI